jgi:hypothetical protein
VAAAERALQEATDEIDELNAQLHALRTEQAS